MDIVSFFSKASDHFEKKLPFVLFAQTDSEKVSGYFQHDDSLHTTLEYEEEGFVIAPFDHHGKALMIVKDNCDIATSDISAVEAYEIKTKVAANTYEKEKYIDLVNKAISHISKDVFEKVVLSRGKKVSISNFNIIELFISIFARHKNTLRYVWFHPETGIWCGATPETLIELRDTSFKTMSLAGTQKVNGILGPTWSDKERLEQQIVTDAIYDALNKLTPVIKISKPYNHKAGNLYHICADVTGVMRAKNAKLNKLISALHPTPAVCGMPTNKAKDFILAHEGYDRSFYTGFLGPINDTAHGSKLFVNLRCMQVSEKTATLYVGGGVILTSSPDKEWLETEHKMQTMVEVIAPLL